MLAEEVSRLKRQQRSYETAMRTLMREGSNFVPVDPASKSIRRHRCLGVPYTRPWSHLVLRRCRAACRLQPSAKREYIALTMRRSLVRGHLLRARRELLEHLQRSSPKPHPV